MSSAFLWQGLCEFVNLSEYEAKAYVSLVKEGPTPARRLSMLCGVPRTKIYETLKKLLERGLVIEVPCNPKKFASLPPGDTFKSLRELCEKKTRDLSAMISFLEKSYMKTVDLVKTRREDVWILFGKA